MSEPAEAEPELSIEEQRKADTQLKAKEAAEQATLPYKWTQTIKDVDVTVPLPLPNLKSRDLEVILKKTEIKVAVKGSPALIEVNLFPLRLFLSGSSIPCNLAELKWQTDQGQV